MMRTLLIAALLVCASTLQAQAPPPDPPQLTREGVALYDQGRFDDAIAKYKQALAADPQFGTASYELSLAYAAKGDYAACRSVLEPLVSLAGSQQIQRLVMLGNCLDSAGDRKKALATYRTALKLAPDDPGVEYELGVALLSDGKVAEARELLKKDVIARPGHVNGHYALGLAFQAEGFRVPALMEFLHYLAFDSVSPRAPEVAKRVRQLLDLGVERKDAKNINVTVDPHPRIEEGDYSSLSTMLALVAGARLTEENEKKSEFEQVQGQVTSVIAMFVESTPATQNDYTARTHRPFFEAMQKAELLDAYATVALSSLHLDGTKEWAAKHSADVEHFLDWIRPQREGKPAVQMPVPPK